MSAPSRSDRGERDLLPTRSVALVTCTRLPDGDDDAAPLMAALARRSISSGWFAWNDQYIDWAAFALAVIRCPWDYSAAHDAFLRWVERVPRLHNAAEVIRWNSNKAYLNELAGAGIPVVPTTLAAPGEQLDLPPREFVLKPSIGAGSLGAGRFDPETGAGLAAAQAHATMLHDAGRTIMVQPYLGEVDTVGETALMYVDAQFSHAVTKQAMLAPHTAVGLAPTDSELLFLPELIRPAAPTDPERDLADRVMAYVSGRFGVPLYARVDLLPAAAGPVVVELELTEPSLFLEHDPASADRLATAIANRLDSP